MLDEDAGQAVKRDHGDVVVNQCVGGGGMVQKSQVNRGQVAARAKKRALAKRAISGAAKSAEPKGPQQKVAAPDPQEWKGQRPGRCPLCGARVAYDDELRMNEHRFKDTIAECAASDREFRWMPETVEEGLPKRQRGGGPIPAKDLERIRRVVTQAVSLHRDAERAGKRMAAKRTDERRAAIRRKSAKANRAKSSTSDVIRCVLCGDEFERPGDESSRRCTICDPPRSTSVRAFRGGLPGLGRRS